MIGRKMPAVPIFVGPLSSVHTNSLTKLFDSGSMPRTCSSAVGVVNHPARPFGVWVNSIVGGVWSTRHSRGQLMDGRSASFVVIVRVASRYQRWARLLPLQVTYSSTSPFGPATVFGKENALASTPGSALRMLYMGASAPLNVADWRTRVAVPVFWKEMVLKSTPVRCTYMSP